MSFKEFREGLSRFQDVQDGPALRRRVNELEERVREKDSQIRKKDVNHGREVNSLRNTITKHEDRVRVLEASVEDFESIIVSIGGQEKVSLREFARLVTSEAKKENQEAIVIRANGLARIKIPLFVEAEIAKYPDNCRQATREIIDAKVSQKNDAILYDESLWPANFREMVSARTRLDAEKLKNRDYYLAVNQAAMDRLEALRNGEWYRYLFNYCRDTLTPFLRDSLRNIVISLQEVFKVSCFKCGNVTQFRLTPDTLAGLVSGRTVKIPCSYCRGFWGPTTISFNLGQVFWALTDEQGSMFQEPRMIEGQLIDEVKKLE
jgi:hypothetical protein